MKQKERNEQQRRWLTRTVRRNLLFVMLFFALFVACANVGASYLALWLFQDTEVEGGTGSLLRHSNVNRDQEEYMVATSNREIIYNLEEVEEEEVDNSDINSVLAAAALSSSSADSRVRFADVRNLVTKFCDGYQPTSDWDGKCKSGVTSQIVNHCDHLHNVEMHALPRHPANDRLYSYQFAATRDFNQRSIVTIDCPVPEDGNMNDVVCDMSGFECGTSCSDCFGNTWLCAPSTSSGSALHCGCYDQACTTNGAEVCTSCDQIGYYDPTVDYGSRTRITYGEVTDIVDDLCPMQPNGRRLCSTTTSSSFPYCGAQHMLTTSYTEPEPEHKTDGGNSYFTYKVTASRSDYEYGSVLFVCPYANDENNILGTGSLNSRSPCDVIGLQCGTLCNNCNGNRHWFCNEPDMPYCDCDDRRDEVLVGRDLVSHMYSGQYGCTAIEKQCPCDEATACNGGGGGTDETSDGT